MYQIAMEIIIPTVRPFIDRNAGKIPALGIPDFFAQESNYPPIPGMGTVRWDLLVRFNPDERGIFRNKVWRIKRNELPLIRTDYPPPMKKANLEGQAKTPLLPPEVHHAERCNRKAGGIESGRVGESEASDQKGRDTRLALGRDAWAEEGDRYSFSRPQTDQLMDRGSSCVEYATPDSLWTGIITFENIDSSLHRALREGHRRPL